MNADEIEEIVAKLLKLKRENKSKEYIDSLSEFKGLRDFNKALYELILAGEYNDEIFKKMMEYKRKLENGEDKFAVDVKFGYFMSEKYIDPVIKNTPPNKK